MSAKQVRGFTVDDASTRDIDDAIWVEKSTAGWTVLVSIADVARAVAIGSENDVRARAMVTTKYFARGNSPMLPRELIEEVCLHINSTLRVEDAELKQRAKDKATTRAKRVTSARQLSGLFAKDFERVCKTWARSTEETPEELVEAFRLRIADGTVPTICVAVAFAEAADVPAWRQIRQALLDSLAGSGCRVPSHHGPPDGLLDGAGPLHRAVWTVSRARFLHDRLLDNR